MLPHQDKLALALLGMLAQQRRYIAAATDSRHLKLIAELYDKCQETLYQVPLLSLNPQGYFSFLLHRICVICWLVSIAPPWEGHDLATTFNSCVDASLATASACAAEEYHLSALGVMLAPHVSTF